MKLIKINTEHYVVVDETIDINENDYTLKGGEIRQVSYLMQDNGDVITHSTQPLGVKPITDKVVIEEDKDGKPLMSAQYVELGMSYTVRFKPLSLQEVKELIGEVNVEKKAELYVWGGVYLTEQEKQQTEIAYMTGYNQALEDNKEKKYTEEDIKKIRQILVEGAITNMSCSSAVVELDKYIQSLQPKTEWEVEIVDGKLKLK